MFNAVFIALVILVSAILITRHYYLGKIEKIELACEDKINLDFRRGFDGGWEAATDYYVTKRTYDAALKTVK